MKIQAITAVTLALALLLPLAGCGRSEQSGPADTDAGASSSLISAEIHKGMEQARRELATKDIDIDHVGQRHHDDGSALPHAAITPQGDLLIAGRKVAATPQQHAMLLDYRQQVVDIAEAGMDIGEHGANLGTQAAKEAILGALAGKSDKEIEARIKPQTEQIKAAAMKLCQRLPGLLSSQQKLAAAMPEFRPYATMTQQDVEDCGKDDDQH